MPFLVLNSTALGEANQKEPSRGCRAPGVGRDAQPASPGPGGHTGPAGTAAAAQDQRRFQGSLGAAPPPPGKRDPLGAGWGRGIGLPAEPAALLSRAAAPRGAPAFAKLAGLFPGALGVQEPQGRGGRHFLPPARIQGLCRGCLAELRSLALEGSGTWGAGQLLDAPNKENLS